MPLTRSCTRRAGGDAVGGSTSLKAPKELAGGTARQSENKPLNCMVHSDHAGCCERHSSAFAPCDDYALSDYERLRLRNIERNNARLASLGLLNLTTVKPSASRPRGRPRKIRNGGKASPMKQPASPRRTQPPRLVKSSETKVRVRIVKVTTRELKRRSRGRKGPGRPRKEEYITTVTKVMSVV